MHSDGEIQIQGLHLLSDRITTSLTGFGDLTCESFSALGLSCPSASRTAGATSSSPRDLMETKLCVWRAARCCGAEPKIILNRRHILPPWGHRTCGTQVWVSQSVPTNSNKELLWRVRAVFSAERTLLQDP